MRHGEPQRGLGRRGLPAQEGPHVISAAQHVDGELSEHPARWREVRACAAPVDEFDAQPLLE